MLGVAMGLHTLGKLKPTNHQAQRIHARCCKACPCTGNACCRQL